MSRRSIRRWAAGAAVLALIVLGLDLADRAFPPPLPKAADLSTVVTDRQGRLLRAFALPEGMWRLPVTADEVDPKFIRLLLAYEDKRFESHHGVDPLAMLRAAGQRPRAARIVSGGSTLSMQLARLIERAPGRSLAAKLRQVVRAVQIERRLDKRRFSISISTFAPYGGNLEGVRAAAPRLFRQGAAPADARRGGPSGGAAAGPRAAPARPRAEAAVPPAKPRFGAGLVADGEIEAARCARATAEPMPAGAGAAVRPPILPEPRHRAAPRRTAPPDPRPRHAGRGSSRWRRAAAALLARSFRWRWCWPMRRTAISCRCRLGRPLRREHAGEIDMASAVRSPGSALKPLIYGLAFEQGLVAQETVIEDRPVGFGGYRPSNFDMTYQGDVSVRRRCSCRSTCRRSGCSMPSGRSFWHRG